MKGSLKLPTEVWYDIFSNVILDGVLPSKEAGLFADLDLFGHPCKIHRQVISNRANLRLVCRLWNEIVQESGHAVISVEGNDIKDPFPAGVYSGLRVEFIYELEKYCRRWPCALTRRRRGRCPQGSYHPPTASYTEEISLTKETKRTNIRILRLLDEVRDPTSLLESCPNLEALWIRYANVIDSTFMNRLSHLHLDSIYAHSQKACRLDLPHLVHLELDLHLSWMGPEGFLLEIHMPHVKTLSLDGYVGPRFAHEVEEFILLAKSSIVNLLISVRHCFVLDLERLTEFPRLSTFGINLSSLTRSVHQELSTIPPPNLTSSLSLIVLGLDDHHRQTSEPRLLWAAHFVKLLSTHRGWFSEIIVPIAWRELGELWAQSSERFDASDIPFNEDDPLPCLWSCLDYIDRHQPLLILDRNRVSLHEGDGAVFAKRMQTYMEDERYRQRRREYSASKADDTENVWIIDPWETRDWEP